MHEWFSVEKWQCAECGTEVDGQGRCTFRGLASERQAKERETERCEVRLAQIAVLKVQAWQGKLLTEL